MKALFLGTNSRYFRLIAVFILGSITLPILVLGIKANWFKNKPICDKCNVILVSLDTLSALHLPCYGYEKDTAPNLCAFADQNILFLNSYSQSSWTMPSHFSIFTSLYSHTHKMTRIFADPLNENYLTLAELLKLNGYQTVYYGPTDDVNLPLDRGFERGFNIINDGFNMDKWDEAYSELIKNAEQKKPTFLFLHTYSVHEPNFNENKAKPLFTDLPEFPNINITWEEFIKFSPDLLPFIAEKIEEFVNSSMSDKDKDSLRQIAEKIKESEDMEEAETLFYTLPGAIISFSYGARYQSKIDFHDPEQIEYLEALYDQSIYNTDKRIDKLLKLVMNDERLSKNTILIITADHGQEFMEHNEMFHGPNLYGTSTQVPLIMHIPDIRQKKITELIQGIDIYPTVIGLTGIIPKSHLEGLDLSDLIMGRKNARTNQYLIGELGELSFSSKDIRGKFQITKINDQDWSFYQNLDPYSNQKKNELYDLKTDPQEQNNVVSLYPDKVNQFLQLLPKEIESFY